MSDASAKIAWVPVCEPGQTADCPLRLNVTLNSEGIEGGGTTLGTAIIKAAGGLLPGGNPPVIQVMPAVQVIPADP